MSGLPLTERQAEVLAYIREFIGSRGFPPTFKEIGIALSIDSSNGVSCHLAALVNKGFLERTPKTARGLKLVSREVAR